MSRAQDEADDLWSEGWTMVAGVMTKRKRPRCLACGSDNHYRIQGGKMVCQSCGSDKITEG